MESKLDILFNLFICQKCKTYPLQERHVYASPAAAAPVVARAYLPPTELPNPYVMYHQNKYCPYCELKEEIETRNNRANVDKFEESKSDDDNDSIEMTYGLFD